MKWRGKFGKHASKGRALKSFSSIALLSLLTAAGSRYESRAQAFDPGALSVKKLVSMEMDASRAFDEKTAQDIFRNITVSAKAINAKLREAGFTEPPVKEEEILRLLDSIIHIRKTTIGSALESGYFKPTDLTAKAYAHPVDSAFFDCLDAAFAIHDDLKAYGIQSKIVMAVEKPHFRYNPKEIEGTPDFHAYVLLLMPQGRKIVQDVFGGPRFPLDRFEQDNVVFGIHDADSSQFAHFNSGDYFYHQEEYAKAIEQYQAAIRQEPKQAVWHYFLAWAYWDSGQRQLALNEMSRAIELAPQYWQFHIRRAYWHGWMGNLQEALKDLEASLTITPNNPEALKLRKEAALKTGDKRVALECLEDWLGHCPSLAGYEDRVERGRLYLELGRPKDARYLLKQALEYVKNRNDTRIAMMDAPLVSRNYQLLGEAERTMGNEEEARKAFSKALEFNPANKDAERYLMLLGAG